jgi:hypothetical protein
VTGQVQSTGTVLLAETVISSQVYDGLYVGSMGRGESQVIAHTTSHPMLQPAKAPTKAAEATSRLPILDCAFTKPASSSSSSSSINRKTQRQYTSFYPAHPRSGSSTWRHDNSHTDVSVSSNGKATKITQITQTYAGKSIGQESTIPLGIVFSGSFLDFGTATSKSLDALEPE